MLSAAARLPCTSPTPDGWRTNGIARASMTGKITASNQSLSVSGSSYIGTVTLTTDADLIRIPRSVGTLTGNSGGSDGSYYYVRKRRYHQGNILEQPVCRYHGIRFLG